MALAAKSRIKPYLREQDAQNLAAQFVGMQTRDQVSYLLEIPDRFLRWILYGTKERTKYREFSIAKKHGGTRRLCCPPKNLRILQDKLLVVLGAAYKPKPWVTGFVAGREAVPSAVGSGWRLSS